MECWFKFRSRVGNVLINVTLRFVRLTVVAAKKIVLNILSVCL